MPSDLVAIFMIVLDYDLLLLLSILYLQFLVEMYIPRCSGRIRYNVPDSLPVSADCKMRMVLCLILERMQPSGDYDYEDNIFKRWSVSPGYQEGPADGDRTSPD